MGNLPSNLLPLESDVILSTLRYCKDSKPDIFHQNVNAILMVLLIMFVRRPLDFVHVLTMLLEMVVLNVKLSTGDFQIVKVSRIHRYFNIN